MQREGLAVKKKARHFTVADVLTHQQARHGEVKCTCGLKLTAFTGHKDTCPKSLIMPASVSDGQSAGLSQTCAEAQDGAGKRRGAGGKLRLSRQPNKTEAEFGLMLEARRRKGEFRTVEFEAITLRVGSGTRYTCDYLCEVERPWSQIELADFDTRPIFFEIKGPQKWDDAIAKFKMAIDRYGRIFRFEMWDRIDGQWRQIA